VEFRFELSEAVAQARFVEADDGGATLDYTAEDGWTQTLGPVEFVGFVVRAGMWN
jgi:hypothetical protein